MRECARRLSGLLFGLGCCVLLAGAWHGGKQLQDEWAKDGGFNSPKFRHFHPERTNEDLDLHSLKHRKHSRRNSEDFDDSEVETTTEKEVCPEFPAPIKNVTQILGREARLECVVDNLGRFRVAWFQVKTKTILTLHTFVISRNYRITLSHSEHRVYILHIQNVQLEDRGPYMCQVNTVPMLYDVAYLDVLVPPDIVESESSNDLFVREGADVNLRCVATGYPKPTFIWRREDYKPVAAGNWQKSNFAQVIEIEDDSPPMKNVSIHEGEVLTIQKVSRLHMGAYLCIASNGVPPAVSRRIVLQVHFPPMIWIPYMQVGVPLGGNVTVECHTEAFPESMNYWSRHKTEVLTQNKKYDVIFRIMSYKVQMVLTIYRINLDDLGTYRCFARNSLGSTEGTINIYQIHLPHPQKEPSSAKIQSVDGTSKKGKGDPSLEDIKEVVKEYRYPNTTIQMFDEMSDAGCFALRCTQTLLVLSSFFLLVLRRLFLVGT